MIRALTITCFFLFFAGVAAFLAQMWAHVWSPAMFLKLIITDGALFAIVFVMAFLIKEHRESKKIGRDEL
ncbi:MAG TPA: hypothetical protein VHB73_06910 [Alphaproteobacteria bacterium]|nr:hypothetical protein [Alphaproteobacteria bacterium]